MALNQPGLPQFAKRSPHSDPRGSKAPYQGRFAWKFLASLIPTAEDIILRLSFPPVNLVRGSGLLAGSGLLLVFFAQHPVLALLGFACVGAGLSTIVPMVFSAAGRIPGIAPGVAMASVTTMGYFGFLAGPPFIGFTAQLLGLSCAFGVIVATSLLIVMLAPAVGRGWSSTKGIFGRRRFAHGFSIPFDCLFQGISDSRLTDIRDSEEQQGKGQRSTYMRKTGGDHLGRLICTWLAKGNQDFMSLPETTVSAGGRGCRSRDVP
jgi:MFS family permease